MHPILLRLLPLFLLPLLIPVLAAEPIREEPAIPKLEEPPEIILPQIPQPLQSAESAKTPLQKEGLNLPSVPPSINLKPDSLIIQPLTILPESPSVLAVMNPPSEATPMNRAALALLTGAFLLAPEFSAIVSAQDPTPAELKRQITELTDSIREMKTQFDSMRKQIEQKDAMDRLNRQIEDMGRKMEELQREVTELKSLPKSKSSTSLRTDNSMPIIGRTAKVRFMNDYIEEVTVVVNRRSYSILPGGDLTVAVPAGTFNYQVLQLQSSVQNRAIREDETKEIRIYVAP